MHKNSLSNNNGKVSFGIDVEQLLRVNNNNNNMIKTIFRDIDYNGLTYQMSKLSVKLYTRQEFNLLHDALTSTNHFRSNIEELNLSIGRWGYSYNFDMSMGSTKISDLFFDQDNNISMTKLKMLSVDGMNRCHMENILDLLSILSRHAAINSNSVNSTNNNTLYINIHISQILCSRLSLMNKLFDVIYHIIVIIKYPILLYLNLEFDHDHFEYSRELSNLEKVMVNVKNQFNVFKEKVQVNYQPPVFPELNFRYEKEAWIKMSFDSTKNNKTAAVFLACANSFWWIQRDF